jgi:hypothetical protein
MASTNTAAIAQLLDFWKLDSAETTRAKPTPITFDDDPVALSWASYGVWRLGGNRWVEVKDVTAGEHDRHMADATRQYYRNRMTMQALRGQTQTEFQKNLYSVLSGDRTITSDQMGVLLKIPYFYAEDVELDRVFAQTKPVDCQRRPTVQKTETITPLGYVFRSRRRMEIHQYWWKDSDGHAVLWSAATNNPLGSLVKGLYNRGQPLTVQAKLYPVRPRGPMHNHVYWQLGDAELM